MRFSELKLSPSLAQSIVEMGFENPTPIQEQAIPVLLSRSTDFLGLAATGTGKTVAFGIPLLEKIDPHHRAVQGLILCPTRELALQVSGQIDLLGKHMGVRALPIYGGAPYPEQIRGLRQGATIVVGTPGRIVDHMERGTLDLSSLQTVVLDEADEMISMGFKDDLEMILNSALESSQDATINTWLFSATMGREVKYFAEKYLNNAYEVRVNKTEIVPDRIDQIYYRAHEEDKPEIICKLIDAADEFYGIIFCQTKALVADLTQYLNGRGYAVDCLHGDMDQNARERAMNGFRKRRSTVLVCTDVASRGLDVKDVTHVINYSLPRELDNYVHRIGRTARSGKTGQALSLVTPSHRGLIGRIERVTKSTMREGKLPTRKEIGKKKVSNLLSKLQNQTGVERAIELLDDSFKSAISAMSHEELAGRFVALTFPDLFAERSEKKESSEQRRESPVKPLSAQAPRTSSARAEVIPNKAPREEAEYKSVLQLEEGGKAEVKKPSWPKPKAGFPKPRFLNEREQGENRYQARPRKPKFGPDTASTFGVFREERKDRNERNDRGERKPGGFGKPFRKGKWQDKFKKKESGKFAR